MDSLERRRHKTALMNDDDTTDDEELLTRREIEAPLSSSLSSEKEESDKDESDNDVNKKTIMMKNAMSGLVVRTISSSKGFSEDLHSRHPWYKKWVQDGAKYEDLLPEQYPSGFHPVRNESKWA